MLKNRERWDAWAESWVDGGEQAWASDPHWGIWQIPESELRLLPDDMSGLDAIELGCGTAYVSQWMARRGARVVGIDNSERQLDTARRLAHQHGVELELVHGPAERVPRPDRSFDFAISEYGASIWADPYVWVPEAWRLLRPGGVLVILGHHPLAMCVQDFTADEPATRSLQEPYFGMHRIDWDDGQDQGTEFNLPISEWFRLFGDAGFDVERFHELRAPHYGAERRYFVTADWARDYPAEQVWVVRKRTDGPVTTPERQPRGAG